MEAKQPTTDVESIEELTSGDTVTVSGNGLDLTSEVAEISESSWTGKKSATLAPVDGYTATLTDSDHSLQSDGITANVGAVTVRRHN